METWERDMLARFPCVSTTVGPEDRHQKEVKILGRKIRLVEDGVELEVDTKYIEQAIESYGLELGKSVVTPAIKEDELDHEGRKEILVKRLLADGGSMTDLKTEQSEAGIRGEPLAAEEQKKFHSVAALLNFVMPDRPDIQFATKEVLRAVARPGAEDLRRLKRILRYLLGQKRVAVVIPWDQDERTVEVCVDADFAGCRSTRKSTCGGSIRWGGALVKSWAKTLPTLALSTGEAELGATVRGAAEAEGIVSILGDFT